MLIFSWGSWVRCALLASVAVCALPSLGVAGSYRVYSCKTPSGAIAPTDGWTATSFALHTSPSNACSAGGSLSLALNPAFHNPATTSLMTWTWEAPAGAAITSYRVWRSVQMTAAYEPNATPVAFIARPVNAFSGAYVAEACRALPEGCVGLGSAPGIHPGNLVTENLEGLADVTRWHISIDCGGVGGYTCVPRPAGQVMAAASLYAAEFTLRDPQPPATRDLVGRLTSNGSHSGVEALSFSASDDVSGVYQSLVEVDGRVVRTALVDSNDGRCADAGVDPTTPYEFLYREPCRKSIRHDLTLDTRTLTDGTHNLKVYVEDASGNRTTVWSNPEFVVRNAPGASPSLGDSSGAGAAGGGAGAAGGGAGGAACVGTGLSARFAKNDASRLTVKHGQGFSVKGRAPANADIDVFHVRGSKVTALGSLRTSASGTFTERFRARHGNGTIRICGPGVAKSLTLRVKAKVSLKVRISNWGLVRYSGRVAGGSIPKGGKIVAIQGKAGPSWQTFALRRTDKKGHFKGRYRLRVVRPASKLKFRVRVPSEAGYPFVGVVSKAQTKRVR